MPGLRDVDADRLFAIDMFARGDSGLKVLHMEVRRRRNLDQVDVVRIRELLVGMRAFEEQLAVDRRLIQARKSSC